ncbi:hypothetical protein F5141DRAFT_1214133 [Pisolithus sp. B1]|nr:hypothetical protein F5141DRAFT_1214133 [Pisolithus sp. B1]
MEVAWIPLFYATELIDFLLGLALSPSTADAAIHEIWSRARPTSLFGTPPPLPLTFPVSPHSSHDSSSPRVQAIYPSIHTPAPPPLAPSRPLGSLPPQCKPTLPPGSGKRTLSGFI